MEALLSVLGWVLWSVTALLATASTGLFFLLTRDQNYSEDGPRSAFWLLTIFLVISLAGLLFLGYSKLHVLWLIPTAIVVALAGDYGPRYAHKWYKDFTAERERTRVERQLAAFREKRSFSRLSEAASSKVAKFKEGEEHDLVSLFNEQIVHVVAGGNTIRSIEAGVLNCSNAKLRIVIRPGTYFVASGSHQNMVTRRDYRVQLAPLEHERVNVDATCINADRPIPGLWDKFAGVSRVPDDVARFLESSRSEDAYTIQAGVWTLTDRYSRADAISHLVSRDSAGNSWHPITEDNCDKAAAILDSLQIAHRLQPTERTDIYDNGTYVGQFRNGKRHGNGKYTWNDGTSVDGEWENGDVNGNAVKRFKDGGRYEGKFKSDREVGGWYYYPNGQREWCFKNQKGEWETGTPPHGVVH